MGNLKKCAVIIVAGNHDSGKRMTVTRNIEKNYGVIIFENPMEIIFREGENMELQRLQIPMKDVLT